MRFELDCTDLTLIKCIIYTHVWKWLQIIHAQWKHWKCSTNNMPNLWYAKGHIYHHLFMRLLLPNPTGESELKSSRFAHVDPWFRVINLYDHPRYSFKDGVSGNHGVLGKLIPFRYGYCWVPMWNFRCITTPREKLVGGWTNPFEKYARQIGSFTQGSGWK